jgi:VanZ family protein
MQSNSFAIRLLEFLKKKKISFVYIPMVVYWLLVSIGTVIPAETIYKYSINDKLEHLIVYFILTIFVIFSNAVQDKFILLRKHPLIFAFLFIAVYGMLNELAQLYIPDRFCDFYDWLADVIGAFMAIILIFSLFGRAFKYNGKDKLQS